MSDADITVVEQKKVPSVDITDAVAKAIDGSQPVVGKEKAPSELIADADTTAGNESNPLAAKKKASSISITDADDKAGDDSQPMDSKEKAPPVIIIADDDVKVDKDTQPHKPNRSDCKTEKDADAQQSSDSKEKASKKPTGASNVCKEKQPVKPKSRVVQSRFRSTLNAPKNSSNNKSGSSNNSSNSLNCTLVGSMSSSSSFGKNKSATTRGPSSNLGVAKSLSNIAKSSNNMGRGMNNILPSKTRPIKSTLCLAADQSAARGGTKVTSDPRGNAKLHSTVLAERTMLGSSLNVFSTTLVGGVEPGRSRLLDPMKEDVVGDGCLPELPDISVIRLDSTSTSGNRTEDLTSSNSSEREQENSDEIFKEVTQDDLDKAYARYLQSVYIDVMSEDAFSKQVEELKTQLVFLDQVTHEKQVEVTELKQKLELLHHYQNAHETYKDHSEQLQMLVDNIPESEISLETIAKDLEKNLHEVKVDNIYIPENHIEYRDEMLETLEKQTAFLDELATLLEPRSSQLAASASLLDELQMNSQQVQQCEKEVNQAVRLAFQDASLQISAKSSE